VGRGVKRRQVSEITNKERSYPTRGYYTQTNPFHNQGSERKIESYNENKRDGKAETCVGSAETGLFNLEIEDMGEKARGLLTLSQEPVLRIRLLVVIYPGGQVGVWKIDQLFITRRRGVTKTLTRIGIDVRVDICLGGELGWIACVIDRIRPLVHSNPIDRHGYRER
jgi:hypothetical protein